MTCLISSFQTTLNIIVTGDLNFPIIDWKTSDINGGSLSIRRQSEMLLEFIAENFLEQCIMVPTRNHNILDLFLTNNYDIVLRTDVEETSISDHNIVIIDTKLTVDSDDILVSREDETELSKMNFYGKNIDLEKIRETIENFNLYQRCTEKKHLKYTKYFCSALPNRAKMFHLESLKR